MTTVKFFAFPRLFLLVAICLSCRFMVAAQRNYTGNYINSNELMTDVLGRPIYLQVNYNIEGSPYFPEEYVKASIYLSGGKCYPDIRVKFNLMENKVLMKLDDGTELVAVSPIARVVFTDRSQGALLANKVFKRGFPATGNQNEESYYEVLDSGKLSLLKFRSASYNDKRAYGQASITRVFTQTESCYLYAAEGTIKKLEKGKESFLSILPDHREELSRFIEQKNLKCRREEDWLQLVTYYNSLVN